MRIIPRVGSNPTPGTYTATFIMSTELRPDTCPLYPNKTRAEIELNGINYVVKDLGPVPMMVSEKKAVCMANFIPDWAPNMHLEGNCDRCLTRVLVTPTSDPWATT